MAKEMICIRCHEIGNTKKETPGKGQEKSR